ECRHNVGYWSGVPYRGFGVGAHSYNGEFRFWNVTSLTDYAARIDAGNLPIAGEERLTPSLRIEEAFMLGLRQSAGLNVQELAKRFGLDYPEEWDERIRHLKDAGLVEFDGIRLRLTDAGRLVATAVTEELLWLFPSSTSEATP